MELAELGEVLDVGDTGAQKRNADGDPLQLLVDYVGMKLIRCV